MPRDGETYEYKVVPAPHHGEKVKGAKTTADRFAHTLETVMNGLAEQGWEYLRADTLPCEERRGLTGTATTYQNVLVFRRALPRAVDTAPSEPAAPDAVPALRAPPMPPRDAGVAPPRAGSPAWRERRSAWGVRNPAPLVAGGDATRTDPRTGRAAPPERRDDTARPPEDGPRATPVRDPATDGAPSHGIVPTPAPDAAALLRAGSGRPGSGSDEGEPAAAGDIEGGSDSGAAITGPAARAARLMGSALSRPDIGSPMAPGRDANVRVQRPIDRAAGPDASALSGPPSGQDAARAHGASDAAASPTRPDESGAARSARQRAVDASTAARAAAAALRLYQASARPPGQVDDAAQDGGASGAR